MRDTEVLRTTPPNRAIAAGPASRAEVRPSPFRTATEPQSVHTESDSWSSTKDRLRKQAVTGGLTTPSLLATSGRSHSHIQEKYDDNELSLSLKTTDAASSPQPISPPGKWQGGTSPKSSCADDSLFDFSTIDYKLDTARHLGQGLWSSVYLAEPISISARRANFDISTPPSTPLRRSVAPYCRIFAIKSPARPDSGAVFKHEARILTALQDSAQSQQYLVPFYGLDPRNSCLVFEGVIGGSLEDLSSRLKVMTEHARHLEVRTLFPELASNLISGLGFLHTADVVHADIKPANILLDIADTGLQRPVLRARYIDFSASFFRETGSTANAGGTWDYMAPEQLRIQKELNEPTFASDVWSLGITLLSVLVGGSPYTSACGSNLFMLREAIKSGDPLGFAQMDPVVHERLAACQDFIDCCRLALQKDRDRRCTAAAWDTWMQNSVF